MNEILDHPVQTGARQLSNQGYDIEFDHVGFAYNTKENRFKRGVFYREAGGSDGFGGAVWRRKDNGIPACGQILGCPEGKDHSGRNGYFQDRAGDTVIAVFYRISGCHSVQ